MMCFLAPQGNKWSGSSARSKRVLVVGALRMVEQLE